MADGPWAPANYSASNAALDAAAWSRRGRGAPTLSVQWGAWQVAGGGMADAAVLQRAARMGIGAVSAPAGLAALAHLLQAGAGSDRPPVAAVSPFHWPAFLALLPRPRPPFFDAVAAAAAAAAEGGVAVAGATPGISASEGRSVAAASTDAARALAALSSADARREAVQASILRIVRDVAAVEVGPADPLMESGIDSLGGVELKNNIEAMYGVELPATAAFDYPSVEALAGLVSEQIDPSLGGDEAGAEAAAGPAWAAMAVPSAFVGSGGGRGAQPSAVAVLGWAGSAPAAAAAVGSLGAAPAAADGLRAMPWDRWDHDAAGGLDPMEAVTAAAAASAKFGAWVPGGGAK